MIHGQNGIVMSEGRCAEESVGREGSEAVDAFFLSLLHCGNDDFLFFVSDEAIVSGMGVKPQHGDTG